MLRASAAALVGGAAAAVLGCGSGWRGTTAPAVDPAALAARYVRLALQLARHQPSLVEQWTGPADPAGGPRVPVGALQTELTALLADAERALADPLRSASLARARAEARTTGRPVPVDAVADAIRVTYLAGQIRALDDAASRLLGVSRPYADQARRTFGQAAPPRNGADLDAQRAELSALLPGGRLAG